MLRIEDLHTYYGNSYILQGIDMEVKPETVASILGRNGMGKTTLVSSIIGFVKPRKGKIIFNGQDVTNMGSYRIVRGGLGLVPQGRQIFPSLSVEENLRVAALGKSGGWNIEKTYELFPPLKERAHLKGNKLSGGEQQMLAIGRSLMTSPSMLLMDEPTEGLSPIYVKTIGKIIRELQGKGISILFVEQNLHFALKYADHVHVMSKGKIVYSASSGDLEGNYDV